jgi:hypothetical protein
LGEEARVSEIEGELARVREAFDKPTLRLLDRKWAPLVLAIFRTSFSRETRSVQSDRLHAQVDAYLAELASNGIDVPPGRNGRALCVQWMNDQWLYRTLNDDDGEEEYSLTSHAVDALELVHNLTRDRTLISGSRINTILDAVERQATEANPDREARLDRLNEQIHKLTAERDRIAAGGVIQPATDEDMLNGYIDLMDLIGQLPGDFKRVEESVDEMHRRIIRDFRDEDRPIGEVLDEYLTRSDELLDSTAEGRAFAGAFALLRDRALLDALSRDIRTILGHPFAEHLMPEDHRDFRGTVSVIRRGIDDVLAQRTRLSATLRDHIVNHDVVRDRELDQTLRQIEKRLVTWMETAGPRSTVDVGLLPATVNVTHLRERFFDPDSEVPPPALEDVSADAPATLSIEEIRKQGGPSLAEMRDLLAAAMQSGDSESVGKMFNRLPENLRRPVEILGLMHLVAQFTVLDQVAEREKFRTVRPDGTQREFWVPQIRLDQHIEDNLDEVEGGAFHG